MGNERGTNGLEEGRDREEIGGEGIGRRKEQIGKVSRGIEWDNRYRWSWEVDMGWGQLWTRGGGGTCVFRGAHTLVIKI